MVRAETLGLELRDLFLVMRICWRLGGSAGNFLGYYDKFEAVHGNDGAVLTLDFLLFELKKSSLGLEDCESMILLVFLALVLAEKGSGSEPCLC